jgi:hypothetical protein
MNTASKMSFRKLINRRNGLLRTIVECDVKAFAEGDSSKFSRRATQVSFLLMLSLNIVLFA